MIRWVREEGRIVAMCGDVRVGAVFLREGARYTRWRAWVTKSMNPVEGTKSSTELAQAEVERRFAEFCELAKLRPMNESAKSYEVNT